MIKVSLHQEDAVWGEKYDLISANSLPINRLLLVNDSIYISDIFDAKPGAPEHQMVHLGRNEVVAEFGEYPQPTTDEHTNPGGLYREFGKTVVVNPKDGRLAAIYYYHNQIKFYNQAGALLKEIEVEGSRRHVQGEEKIMYRAEPVATEKHIYILYLGMAKNDIMENSDSFRPILEVWDWQGNILDRFQLDQPLTTFAVSEAYEKLYGISFLKRM